MKNHLEEIGGKEFLLPQIHNRSLDVNSSASQVEQIMAQRQKMHRNAIHKNIKIVYL